MHDLFGVVHDHRSVIFNYFGLYSFNCSGTVRPNCLIMKGVSHTKTDYVTSYRYKIHN